MLVCNLLPRIYFRVKSFDQVYEVMYHLHFVEGNPHCKLQLHANQKFKNGDIGLPLMICAH